LVEKINNHNESIPETGTLKHLRREVASVIFNKPINKLDNEEERQLEFINNAYWTTKSKMYNMKRNDNSDTFNHILRVVYSILRNSRNPTLLKVLIAMNHDNIEDTDITIDWLKNSYLRHRVALWVKLISKDPFYNFIKYSDEKWSDYQIFEEIKQAWENEYKWILNDKNILSDDFIDRKQKHYEKYKNNRLTQEEYISLKEDEKKKNISPEEWSAYDKYQILEKKYKEIRNETNFKHMESLETFFKYAQELRDYYKLKLDNNDTREVALEALEDKYWDRIDNLQTSEIYTDFNKENLKKAKRKLKETEKYFYDISKETHPYIHKLIKAEVERLKAYIFIQRYDKYEEGVLINIDKIMENKK